MKVAVVGMGLFGRSLSIQLARAGAEVVAIDSRRDLVDDMKDHVSLAVRLDATDERELRAQGIQDVDVLVACIGDDFEANQLLVLLAKQIGVKRVVARAPTPAHARILRMIGADDVVMPEAQAAAHFSRRVAQPSLKCYFELIEGYSVAELAAPASLHDKTLAEVDLKRRWKVNLVAITRPDPAGKGKPAINAVPLGTDVFRKGDILAVAGRDEDIRRLLAEPPG